MNKKLRLLAGLPLALSLVASGCSGGGAPGDGAKQGGEGASPSADNGKAPYEVTLVYMGNESTDIKKVSEAMSQITKQKINATIKLQPISAGAWAQQTNLALTSQEKIDIFMASSIYNFSTQVAAGHFLPVDDLLAKYGQDITKLLDPSYLNAGKVNGKQYALPTNKDMATQGGVIMRKDMVEKYKIDLSAIKTIADLDAVFATIKKNEPQLTPIATASALTPVDILARNDALVDKLGVLPNYDNGLKVENLYERPEYAELLKTMRKWYEAGYFSRDAATSTEQPHDVVKANKAFAFFNVMKVGTAESQSLRTGMPMVTVPLTDAVSTTSHVTNFMHAIPRGSQNPEKAMQMLNLLYTDKELVNLLNWGIEGTHYVKKSDTVIDYPPGVDIKTVSYNTGNISFMFGNQFLNYIWPNQLKDIWQQTDQFNKGAKKSVALGFTFDATPVKTEVGAVNNVLQQYKAGLETGTLDPEKTLPTFISRLKTAGMDKIIAEKQAQLDRWKAAMK
ncbi:putative aldouronate transport system substrate-binding protein [Paenibacillus sp. UNCCL117]|uniref:ABC transporter substrate-binding protein n=1 Tax=unclassified Paenibacillus TaxID=185978 RepID=UPI00088954AC|nr:MULTISPECIES: ABC transporter substrate-binding protein [unclassified Paenibacillus]SDD02831.1 carbohydrate ABC transporter substrate-binding protein, CUT1 family [Paenibacillus sp. cl123]SFW32415.1 putative aldouronate transport system substrate-binding protein [Paenibacillus sp. UNCCL117]